MGRHGMEGSTKELQVHIKAISSVNISRDPFAQSAAVGVFPVGSEGVFK